MFLGVLRTHASVKRHFLPLQFEGVDAVKGEEATVTCELSNEMR